MGNILSILQQIFMGKEDENLRIGISEFKRTIPSLKSSVKTIKKIKPQQLRLSELMRKGA